MEATAEEKPKRDNGEEKKQEAPPPPPEEVEMRVYMHCKGCAKKVKKILMKFDGNATISDWSNSYLSPPFFGSLVSWS